MKKLYFIRHGLSELNQQERWAGRTDTPLTEEGRHQAQKAGEHAQDLAIDLIVASPLIRAKETAEIIADGIDYPKEKIIYSDLLVERSWGDLEGLPHSTPIDDLESVPNIEPVDDLLERAAQALAYLESLKADNILVVSHGTFGRALRHHILEDMPFANKTSGPEFRLPNGEVICWI